MLKYENINDKIILVKRSLQMEKIKIFIEEIQKENIIDIAIAIGVILLFFIISSWGTKLILRILKVQSALQTALFIAVIYS